MIRLEKIIFDPKTFLELDYKDKDFLCVKNEDVWVSRIYFYYTSRPDFSLPKNCSSGCLYVQPKRGGPVIRIDDLEEIYLIGQEGE